MKYDLIYYLCHGIAYIAAAGGVLDMMSTIRALALGGREANWAWRWVMDNLGKPAFMMMRVALALGVFVMNTGENGSWLSFGTGVAGAALLFWVAHRNYMIGEQMRLARRARFE